MHINSNKKIARNTLFLYFRMMLTMVVSLYTSRVLLNALGIQDFGIYSVVAGVVSLFSFLNGAMTSGTQRFLSFELGKADTDNQFQKVFSHALLIHFIIGIIMLLLAESAGLWLLDNKLVIPGDRMIAARWVFHFTVISLFVAFLQMPYNAAIVAYEEMSFFAYISILEVILKLTIIFLLLYVNFDRLIVFSILSFCISSLVFIAYFMFCIKKYPLCKIGMDWDKHIFYSLTSFAGWSLFGSLAWVGMGQGINIILNMFFGPAINAARGIAFQVNGAVMTFVNNFRIAVNPQIIKSCAAGKKEHMDDLVFDSAKYSYFLILLFALPLILEANLILRLWLTEVPEHSVSFCRLTLINTLIVSFDGAFFTLFQAYGRIKANQILSGVSYLTIVPLSYFLLQKFSNPLIVFYLQIVASIFVAFVVKPFLMKKIAQITFGLYFWRLILPTLVVTFLAVIFPIFIYFSMIESITRLLVLSLASTISVSMSVFYFGITRDVRIQLRTRIKHYWEKAWE